MAKCNKLLDAARRSPNGVRLEDALKLAECYGFVLSRTSSSHHICKKDGTTRLLNFQRKKDGTVPSYQVRQLLQAIEADEASTGERFE